MAQAQYDKFIELRKSWVDALTARKQAYWDIPTAPTVTPAPTTPAPVAPQPTVQGVNGETFQVAPVNAQGVTPQAPQSVAPVQPVTPNTPPPTQNVTPTAIPAEIKPTTPETKKVEPIDFNLSQGREWDIQKNVADITSTNPTLLKDRNAYNKAFGYETADQWKKALLDSAFQSGQPQTPNADMMFSSILAKAPVPDDQKTTTQYKIAQNRYLKANSYASMTPSQLSSDITSGKLIEWSQTYEDIKSMNPKLVQDTNNLRIVNGSKVSLYSNDAQGNKVNNVEQSFTEDYLGNFGTFLKTLFTVQTPEQIKAAIYTDDVQQAQDKATSIELELNQIEADQAKMEEITRKELEWTGASAERIRLEVGIRQDKLQNQYNSKLKEYNTYANKANNLITQNTTVYQESMKQQSAQQQALAGAAWQVFSSELAKENAVFEANLWLQTKQAEFEQWLAQQAEMAKDPTTAIWGILSQFQKLGITSDMDVAGHLASFQASGLSLPEYTKQMIENFKAKPEYQKAMQLQMGQLSDAQKMSMWYAQDLNKMAIANQYSTTSDIRNFAQQKEIAKLNNDYNRQDFLFQLENDPAKRLAMAELEEKLNANKSLFDVLGKNVGTYEGNRWYDLAGKLWDPMPAGGNWKVKSVIDANYTSSPYGNSVLMEDENGNEVRYSHLQSIWVKPWDQLWFGDVVGTRGNTGNVKWANGETLTAEQLAKWRGAHLDVEIKSGGKLLSQDEQVDYLKSKKAWQVNSPLSTLGQFMKDNQDRGTGYSNDDVKAFNEKIDRLVKAWDTNGMALAYRNMVMKDKDFKKEFDDTTVFVQALDQVQSMINEYEAAWKSTNALKWMAEKVSRKLGITQDEALAKLQTQLGVTMANYIRSISGTAASDVEVQRLMWNMAQIGNVKNLNTAIVEQVRNNGLWGLKKMIDNRMYGMPEDLKPAVFWDIYTQTQNSSTPSSPNYNFQSDWENL